MASNTSTSGGLLKVIFLAHLVLSSWGMMSPYFVPNSYVYYNVIYMIALMWAIAANNVDSIIMAILINCVIIIMDAFALAFSWPRTGSSRERLYFGLAIANEVLRPVATTLLYRVFKERDTENQGIRGIFEDVIGGNSGGSSSGQHQQQGYETISGGNQREGQQKGESSGTGPTGSYQGTNNSGDQNV